jgi:replicative DNA helicase
MPGTMSNDRSFASSSRPATTSERLVPANVDAERAVLGSVLIDPDAIIKIAPTLRVEDFFVDRHRWIYEATLALHERRQAVDFVTLCDELERRGQLTDIGGQAYIIELLNVVPTAINVEHYAGIVVRTAILRRLIDAAGQIARMAYEDKGEIDEIVDRAEELIFGVSEQRIQRTLAPISQVMREVTERVQYLALHQGELMGVPAGFRQLDKLLGGFQKSDLIILAARPSVGKTALALNIAVNAAKRYGQRVAFFSLEMSAEQLVLRLLAAETGIDQQRLRLGQIQEEEWGLLMEAAGVLSSTMMFIDDTPALSALEMRTKARRVHAEHGLDLIVVDYLQLMRGDPRSENRVQEISYISRALKGLARELNVPVLALSQLSRAVEARTDKRPMLSDLRESGSIEQDADVVMFIYREDMYNEGTDRQNIADVIVAKHRNGPTGVVSLYFKKELTQFLELETYREPLNTSEFE